MSLAFLAKKTWHVTNFQNQEAVWKAEQAQAEEQRKLELRRFALLLEHEGALRGVLPEAQAAQAEATRYN